MKNLPLCRKRRYMIIFCFIIIFAAKCFYISGKIITFAFVLMFTYSLPMDEMRVL